MKVKIKWTRVILGGAAASVVVILIFLGLVLTATPIFLVLPADIARALCAAMALLSFLMSVLMIWIYAIMRERQKPGMGTAMKIGGSLGFALVCFLYLGWRLVAGPISGVLWVFDAFVIFIGLLLAAMIGAWIYEKPAR